MSRFDQFPTRPPIENSTGALPRHAQKHKASRAPMVNPYDKFTQPEFDAWIGDMTTSIRRALGFEQEEPCLFENIHVNDASNGGLPEYPELDLSDQDEVPDDSFALIKARRDKGKARDPREGPGLGKDRTLPIELVSSDEEEEDEVKALALSLRVDDPGVYEQEEDAESDYLWERSPSDHIFSSPPARIGPPFRSRKKGEESNAGSEDDDNDEYDDDDDDFVNQANDSSEVINISSDEEEGVDEEDDYHYHNRPGPSSSRYPRDESDEEDERLGADCDVDEIQPLNDDTSFPPRHISPNLNLQLNGPWGAPMKYAEDFSSRGELRLPAGAQVHPDHLGPLDEDIEVIDETEELSRLDAVVHSNETSSDLRSTSEFYQAYYSEANVITSWDQELDPRLFARTESVDNDIDAFLTPGVLTPNQSELRTHPGEAEDAVEIGFRNERAGSLSLPILPPVLSLKRNEPIPQGAEIIAIDDSDDDGEDSLVVVPPLDAILEMGTEPATGHSEEAEMSEESPTFIDFSTPFVPVVDIFDNVGEDEVLSVYTAHTEDIENESRLQPLEIIEPEAEEPSLAMSFDLEPVPPDDLEVEEQDNREVIEPEVTLLNTDDTLPLDARPESMVEVDVWAPNYYEDFDDIYETPAPDISPLDSSEGVHLQPAVWTHEDIEVDRSQDSGLASSSAGNTGDIQYSAAANGLRNAVSTLSSPKTPEFTTKTLPVLLSPSCTSTVPGQPQIPMPVMADANVPDPTESPTRLQEHAILSIPGTPDITVTPLQTPQIAEEPAYPTFPPGPLLHLLNPNADGLFTPADFSIPTTPAEDSGVAMPPSECHDVTSSPTVAPVGVQVQAELTAQPAASPKKGAGDIFTETDIISSARKSVLMADPYPYCLSTPIASTSDDGSSEENDDNSICSHSTAEKEDEKVEVQSAFPLASDIGPHINPQKASMEVEDTSLTKFDFQAITTSTENLLDNTTVEELGILPTLDEKDSLVAMELRDPFQPTLRHEDSFTIHSDMLVEGSQDQLTATIPQPLEGVDADFHENLEANPKTPLDEKNSTILEDSHLQASMEVKKAIPQSTQAASRPSKRKRETSPDPDGFDGLSVKSRDKLRARSKGKQRGKGGETDLVEQPPEHDTIYVRSRPSRAIDSATSELSENSRNVDAGVSSEFSKSEVSQPPRPQFHAPSLFHAHGRTKRQKTHIQPIASVMQTRDQPAPQPTAQPSPVVEPPPSHSVPSRKPPPLDRPVLPSTAGAIASEVRHASKSPGLPRVELSRLSSTTAAPAVEPATQEDVRTSPQLSIATADENLQPTHSTPTTSAPFQPTPSLQSSPTRFLQASSAVSSIRSTRSQCKYHKITLPIGENGRRVCFLVPGCSLTNEELMQEEDIEDQGEATYEDSLRMIQNIDHLDFDPYLIGILRQLVGLDILREGEVFFLPQPGDDIPRKHWPRKSNSSTAKGSDYTSFAGSPGYSYSGSARSPSTRPPLSNADSVFTSPSGITDGSDMDKQLPSQGKTTWNGKTKDITSQPHEHDEELPDEEPTQKTKRKYTKRGVKRTRTHDGATGNDGTRKSKRLRLHLTDSSLHQSQQHD